MTREPMEFRDVSQDAWWPSGTASTAVCQWKAASLPVRAAAPAAAGVPVPAPAGGRGKSPGATAWAWQAQSCGWAEL